MINSTVLSPMKSSLSLEDFKKTERIGTSKVNIEQMLPEAGSWIIYFDT